MTSSSLTYLEMKNVSLCSNYMYFSLYILSPPRITWWKKPRQIPLENDVNWEKEVEEVSKRIMDSQVERCQRYMAVAWQARVYGSFDGKLTLKMLHSCVEEITNLAKHFIV